MKIDLMTADELRAEVVRLRRRDADAAALLRRIAAGAVTYGTDESSPESIELYRDREQFLDTADNEHCIDCVDGIAVRALEPIIAPFEFRESRDTETVVLTAPVRPWVCPCGTGFSRWEDEDSREAAVQAYLAGKRKVAP